jgi:hypothetical protein
MAAFLEEPDLSMLEACHYEKFGQVQDIPTNSTVHFRGDDPQAGPVVRYTTLTRRRIPPSGRGGLK